MLQAQHLQWLSFFPPLNSIHHSSWQKMLTNSTRIHLQEGQMVFRYGECCANFLFILSGIVRVKKRTKDGHEITLYRLGTGQVCELTTTCLLANNYYCAEAVAESPVSAVMVPKVFFFEALSNIPEFRDYIYEDMQKGLGALLSLLEDVAFGSLEVRLAKCLVTNLNQEDAMLTTHQKIAANIGTVREVVSRTLKKFEQNGWVKLSRGKVQVLDKTRLMNISNNHLY